MSNWILLLSFVCTCGGTSLAQRASPPPDAAIRIAVHGVSQRHFLKPPTDDEYCGRWFREYLDTLDPGKLYFVGSDISEFETWLERLPKLATTGDASFLRLVTARFKLRVKSAMEQALDLVGSDFDFSADETLKLDYEKWPGTLVKRRERWRLQVKYDLLVERSRFGDDNEIGFLKARYQSVRDQAAAMTEERAVGLYLDSFCRVADHRSRYFTKSECAYFERQNTLVRQYSIGLTTTNRKGRRYITFVDPAFCGTPNFTELIGCELLAIRGGDDTIHNCREIFPSTTYTTIESGLGTATSVTLELYDESRLKRFAVNWPRISR